MMETNVSLDRHLLAWQHFLDRMEWKCSNRSWTQTLEWRQVGANQHQSYNGERDLLILGKPFVGDRQASKLDEADEPWVA